jgi:REP element-mobilizing transposase RayT
MSNDLYRFQGKIPRHFIFRGISRRDILFSPKEYYAAMNAVALTAERYGVDILSLCFMTNHFHVPDCSYLNNSEYSEYVRSLVIALTRAVRKAQYSNGMLGNAKVKPIISEADLKDCVSYCARNPAHHNITEDILNYPYSSSGVFFNIREVPSSIVLLKNPLSIQRFLPEKRKLPDGYVMSKDGLILPESYVAKNMVENLFQTRQAYLHYLSVETQREKNGEHLKDELIDHKLKYTDDALISIVKKRSIELSIADKPFEDYSKGEKDLLVDYIEQNKLSLSIPQICRILAIPPSTLYYRRSSKRMKE